jgi:diguanylate cyclase (GGDEF)-like protein/PAS domain S-box-containing protein
MPWVDLLGSSLADQLRVLRQAISESRDGISIADARQPDCPLIFVNPAFERMTGYSFEEVVGRNCRYLQGSDKDQQGLAVLRAALRHGEPCVVVVRNYRKDGTLFHNELSISPVHDASGTLTHYMGIQKDVTARITLEAELEQRNVELRTANDRLRALSLTDALTGLFNRRHFDEQLQTQWQIARRTGATLSIFMIDIDHFKGYNDRYGHLAGDACLCDVARALGGAFMRVSDFIARYGGEEFVVLAAGMTNDQASRYADSLCQRVSALKIPHAGTPVGSVSVSVGHATARPDGILRAAELVARADQALYQAKAKGRNQAVAFTDPPGA